jgi:hypothetical protein
MKKTFTLSHPKKNVDRVVDSIKHEVKKYFKRERNKKLPSGTDYWDFDCQFGNTQTEANPVHYKELNKCIDAAVDDGVEAFYVEILARAATRNTNEDDDDYFGE